MIFERTYTLLTDSPPPMDAAQYRLWVESAWQALLGSDPQEAAIQDFLERHPALIPGAFGLGTYSSGHAPFPGGVISQPELYGYQARRPDFMWISKNSTSINPVLVEIESPGKRLFTQGGLPTAQFSQARNQLAQWKAWFANPVHQLAFLEAYGIDLPYLEFEPHFLLIYGRRDEYEKSKELTRLRGHLMGTNEHLMSYDRLYFEPKASELPSLRHTVQGYRVLHISPVTWLGPGLFDYDTPLSGRLDAVDRNALISEPRKAFLKSRLPYWEEWREGPRGIVASGDRE